MTKLRSIMLATALGFAAQAAMAGEIVIPLEDGLEVGDLSVTYDCAGEDFPVRYINAGPSIGLASFTVEGEPIVAAITVSASGARYQGGRYIWWTKGDEASLYDVMAGPDADPIMTCRSEAP